MNVGRYTDANDYKKVKNEYKQMGLPTNHVKAVDMDYGFVPTSTSQAAKGGKSNLNNATAMNSKRFGLE